MTRRTAVKMGSCLLCGMLGLGTIAGCAAPEAVDEDAVAATFDGEAIYEWDITEEVRVARISQNLEDDEAWARWLGANDYDASVIRQQAINAIVGDMIIEHGAHEKGIEVDESAVDEEWEQAKARYGSEEGLQAALDTLGMTHERYRNEIRLSLENKALRETFADDTPPTDEELLAYAQMQLPGFDGARRSSQILFKLEDKELAQEVLEKLKAGTLDFADAAREYSVDGTAEAGGDVGWDCLVDFVDEYAEPLKELAVGDLSDLVESDYGIHIIQCTDAYEAPEEVTSTKDVPQEFLDAFAQDLRDQKEQEAFSNWYLGCQSAGNLVIHDMPAGLPYDVEPVKEAS